MTTGSVHHFVANLTVDFTGVPTDDIRRTASEVLRHMYDVVNSTVQAFADGNAELTAEAINSLAQDIAYVNCAMTELTNRPFCS